MKVKYFFIPILSFLLLLGCGDSKLLEHWKDPDIEDFKAQKILILAITNDTKNRQYFEETLAAELNKKNVSATPSYFFLTEDFFNETQPLEKIDQLESGLITNGYDAVLVSKIIGAKNKVTLLQSYKNLRKQFDNFEEDYYESQSIYPVSEENKLEYTEYHAESVLYCLCPDKKTQRVWRAAIQVTKTDSDHRAIKNYIKLLTQTLKRQNILI